MTTPSERLLLSLRDFIGDALSEPDITPLDIIEAIRDELKELQDYHKVQNGKIQKLLGMIQVEDDIPNFQSYLTANTIDELEIAEDLDNAIRFYNGESARYGEDTGSVWDSLDTKNKNRYRKMDDK